MMMPCIPPDPHPRPPRFAMPAGATDSHAHVIDDPSRLPYVAERSYTPPPAPLEAYKALHRVLGIERAVLVTISVYGTNNSVALEAIAGYGKDRARGIAVVDETVSDDELARLDAGGFRGARFNVVLGGGVGLHTIQSLAPRLREMGWHIQLFLDVRKDLEAIEPQIRACGMPVVIDHMGHMPATDGIDHPGFQRLLNLVRDGVCWAKLSGNYRISDQPPHYPDAIPFARALIEAAPQHMVWGTDWPHVTLAENMPNDGDLLDALDDYAPEPAMKQAILVDNPARLYGFD